ncbi:hypothetical protein CRV08_13220 [Halarcobacter ebronensis]|uniref:Uncharacterized protein n=1 Tax=Halarcobacter ebronensis TaxID=1462615 RepID=A0A4Q0YC18_9BACT|nr:hypothetical protein [Halarcobacter ebronensis]RXJ66431.1 hypothetical protein CRV08_13220 [Halarcobacter ebronensis]
MSYEEIFGYGWSLNFLMFILNVYIGIKSMNTKTKEQLLYENKILSRLKNEFDKYYPYRKYETIISYLIPFTAFFRVSFRLFEMTMFFNKNRSAKLFDYMIFKYQSDIKLAKNRIK